MDCRGVGRYLSVEDHHDAVPAAAQRDFFPGLPVSERAQAIRRVRELALRGIGRLRRYAEQRPDEVRRRFGIRVPNPRG